MHSGTRHLLGLCALALLLPACQSVVPGRFRPFDQNLTRLYDQASPDGMIEIELQRNGRIEEMEADIDVSALPANVLAAARKASQGATITGAEIELQQGGDFYEVKLHYEGRDWELVIDGKGNVIETEKELDQSEAPGAVIQAAAEAIPGSALKSVEVIESADMTEYHVKRLRDGASYKVVLAPDGTVKRAVREARAEIEIPLVD